ncbi:MAG: right-handed parallel beta-helix repeat-containing protein [Bacteroidota bacterium]
MVFSQTRALLAALFVLPLLLTACDASSLTGSETPATAAPASLESAIAAEIDAVSAESMRSAEAAAAEAALGVQMISGPTTITEEGFYTLAEGFATEGDGIVIQANNVFLDLGGHTITGPGNKAGRGIVLDGVSRVLVSNGTVATFGIGVQWLGSSRTAVVGVTVEGGDEFADPPNGIAPQIGFLLVNSARNRVLGNVATDTNLGIFVRGGGSFRNRILGNRAEAGENGLLGVCYNPAPNTEDLAGPERDLVAGNALIGFGVGIQVSEGSANNRFVENLIGYLESPYEDANGTNVFDETNETFQIGEEVQATVDA